MARVKTSTSMSPKKKVASVTAIVLCLALLLGGAFAWKDFSQAFTNILKQHPTPDVLLHDDFTPNENKDVYVENTGDTPAYVRISFHEFLQIGNDAVFAGTKFDDKTTWKKHLFTTMPAADGKVSDWNLDSDKYYDWYMTGAQKNYLKGTSEIDDITYADSLVGTVGANGQKIAKTAAGASIVSMATWTGWSDTIQGQYKGWILDTDGYAYWSQKLLAGEATNLLLDNVKPKDGVTADDNMYYAIDVRLQATNATELHKMFDDMSDAAKAWLEADSAKPAKSAPIEDKIDGATGTGLSDGDKATLKDDLTGANGGLSSNIELDNEKNVYEAAKEAQDALKEAIADGATEAVIEDLARKAESLETMGDRINEFGELPSNAVVVIDDNGFAKVIDKTSRDTLLIPQNFPDSELLNLLMTGFSTAKREFVTPGNYTSNTTLVAYSQPILGDGTKITQSQMNGVTELILNNLEWNGSSFVTGKINISSLEGIELFPNLEMLQVSDNQNLTSYTASNNPKLKWLQVSNTNLSEINIQKCPDLDFVLLAMNPKLTKVDVSKNTALKWMNITDCNITGALDLRGLTQLKTLTAFNNPNMTSVNLSECSALGNLQIYNTGIDKLDVSGLTSLYWIAVRDCPNLTSIDASGCSALTTILAYWSDHQNGANHGPLQSIDLTGCTSLTVANSGQMQVHGQSLTELDISMTDFASGGNHARFQYNNISKLTVKTGTAAAWVGTTGNNNTYHKLGNPYTVTDVTVVP